MNRKIEGKTERKMDIYIDRHVFHTLTAVYILTHVFTRWYLDVYIYIATCINTCVYCT